MNPLKIAEDRQIAALIRAQPNVRIERISDRWGNDTLAISFDAPSAFSSPPKPTDDARVWLASDRATEVF